MPAAHPHIYVVDDDLAQRSLLSRYLELQQLRVTAMSTAEEMLRRLPRHRPDLIVLDLGLPGISGLQACQRLRLDGDRLPIIMLTARADEHDRVLCLESGADDYLSKPFSARELLARIRAVLRRAALPFSRATDTARVRIGEWEFCIPERCLVRGETVRVLGGIEYSLLAELVHSAGRAVSRERLLAVSHPWREEVLPRAIDAAVMRLRKQVEPDPAHPVYIRTVRGEGYMFVPMPAPNAS